MLSRPPVDTVPDDPERTARGSRSRVREATETSQSSFRRVVSLARSRVLPCGLVAHRSALTAAVSCACSLSGGVSPLPQSKATGKGHARESGTTRTLAPSRALPSRLLSLSPSATSPEARAKRGVTRATGAVDGSSLRSAKRDAAAAQPRRGPSEARSDETSDGRFTDVVGALHRRPPSRSVAVVAAGCGRVAPRATTLDRDLSVASRTRARPAAHCRICPVSTRTRDFSDASVVERLAAQRRPS